MICGVLKHTLRNSGRRKVRGMPDEIEEIAERLERAADRYHNAADFQSKTDSLNASAQVRRARSAMEARQIEEAFLRSHPPDGGPGDLAGNAGCLGGWLGGGRRTVASSGPWRSTTARSGWAYRPGMIRGSLMSGRYNNLTVHQAIARHTPPGYDPQTYAASVTSALGIAGGAVLGALAAAQVAALADAIERDPNWQKAPPPPPLGSATDTTGDWDASMSTGDFQNRYDEAPGARTTSGSGAGGGWSDVSGGGDFGTAAPSDNS